MKKLISVVTHIIIFCIILCSSRVYARSSCDTNNDRFINAIDVLRIINALNSGRSLTPEEINFLDVNRDGFVNAIDALIIINYLNLGDPNATCGREVDDGAKNGNPPNGGGAGEGPPANDDEEIILIKSTEHLSGSYFSIDEFKQIDPNALVTGGPHNRRVVPTAVLVENRSTNDTDIITTSENNLSEVWGHKRINKSRKISPTGRAGGVDSGTIIGSSTAYGSEYDGNGVYSNGAGAKAEYITEYEADGINYLNISNGKEIYLRMHTDGLSGTDANSAASFFITLTDSAGKSHTSTYTAPLVSSIRDMITGGIVIKVRLKHYEDKIDLSQIAKFSLRMMTRAAQDNSLDYIRISLKSVIGSPEDRSAASEPPVNNNPPACKYAKLNYMGESDSIQNWEDVFKDSENGSRAGKVFDFENTSSIKNKCIKQNIEAVASFCGGVAGILNVKAEDLYIASGHIGHGNSLVPPVPPEEMLESYCKNVPDEHKNLCKDLRAKYASIANSGDVLNQYYNAHANGRTVQELFEQDNTYKDLILRNSPSVDDCIFESLISEKTSSRKSDFYSHASNMYSDFKALDTTNNPYAPPIAGDFSTTQVFDENCKALSQAELGNVDPRAICDNINMRTFISPISLHWNTKSKVHEKFSIVSFPLENIEGKFYHWRASEDMPLLVYDPMHNGNITSASQLFGTWTFGGKSKTASINENIETKEQWDNGYEALASLDINKNGSIESAELEPLGLWFDSNQNGISESGEVKTLSEVDITKLFYGPTYTEADGKSVSLKIGFERTLNGKTISGSSTDWYSDSFDSETEAIINFETNKELSKVFTPEIHDNSSESAYGKENGPANELNGTWTWRAKNMSHYSKKAKNIPFQGYFQFRSTQSSIEGLSMFEMPVEITQENRVLPAKTISQMLRFNVQQLESKKEGTTYAFSQSVNGVQTQSSVLLFTDAMTGSKKLHGTTTSSYVNQKTGKSASLSYEWEAEPGIQK